MDNFFYNLNKKMADLATKQDLSESRVAESEKWIQKAINPAHKGDLHKALHVAPGEKIPKDKINKATHSKNPKLRHMAQFAKNVANEDQVNEFSVNKLNRIKHDANKIASDERMSGGDETRANKAERVAGKASVRANDKVQAGMKANQGKGVAEGHCSKCAPAPCSCNEGNAFTDKLKATAKGGKFKMGNKEYTDTSDIEEGAFKNLDIERQEQEIKKSRHNPGNSPLRQVPGMQNLKPKSKEHPLKNVARGIKAFVKGEPEPMDEVKKAKPDYPDIDHDGNRKESMKKAAADKTRSTGTAFDPEARKKSKTDQEGTGNFDKKKVSTGTVYTRRHKEDDEEVTSNEPKRKGRPKGPAKGPERVTAKAWKHKDGRQSAKHSIGGKMHEDGIPVTDRGEYDDEAGMAKDQLHTIVRHARELERALGAGDNLPEWVQEKMGQIKGMMTSVTDYMLSQKERGIEADRGEEGITMVPEKAPPGAKAERMVKGIKKSLSKDGNLSGKDKAIAYATTWKAHNQGKVEEESTDKKDQHAERAGRRVAKDIEYDEKKKDGIHGKRRGSEDNKAEKAGRQVAKDIEYDEKHKKVKETTSGSVASAPAKATTNAGGMTFGKGVYEGAISESYEKKLSKVLSEGMNVTVTMNSQPDGGPSKTINVTADGEDAEKLAEILKLAGLGGQSGGCSSCGQSSCGCETVDEAYGDATATKNNPDWPTDTETTDANDPYLRRFSGGLNGAKSTGQTTVPVIASQVRRQVSMEENVELERSLFKTWKNYKG